VPQVLRSARNPKQVVDYRNDIAGNPLKVISAAPRNEYDNEDNRVPRNSTIARMELLADGQATADNVQGWLLVAF